MKISYNEKKLKEYEVKILDYFVKICDKNNLDYYLAYGTLLGAVRHKGFIPWDDDIDVYMKPEEYYKFKDIMLNKKDDKFFYQSLETEKYYNFTFAKIRMNNTKAVEKSNEKETMHKGIYIDIFPLIPYPNEKKDQKILSKNIKMINLLIQADMIDKSKYNSYGKVGKMLSKILKIIPRVIRNKIAIRKLEKVLKYNKEYDNYICIFDNTKFSKRFFDKNTKLDFENKKYKVPKMYDEYLTTIYGDYMKIPKEEDRKTHSFVCIEFGGDVEDGK